MRLWIKEGRWFLLLAGCLMFGCVSGPLPEKAAWPWESSKDYDKFQTGNFIGIRGNVAKFDEPPKAVKPVSPEAIKPPIPDSIPAIEASAAKSRLPLLPVESETVRVKPDPMQKKEYDFTLRDIKTAPPSYLPIDSIRAEYDITAFNHGNAPVSVTIGIDPATSQNISADKTLPFNFVVKPNSEQALVHIGQKAKTESYNFRSVFSWNIGDYTASHNCPEHYQFPFANNVQAFAHASDNANTSAYTRYSVIFSVPVGTRALVARKGAVVQIRTDKIDILHDDSTIATYGHLGKISEDMSVGKVVSTEDVIGVVGSTADNKEGYLQLTVWRPEPLPTASLRAFSQSGGFDAVSFPLEFCTADSSQCRVITQDQMVSRNKITEARKQGTRKSKSKGIK